MTGTVLRRICVTRRGFWSYWLRIYCLPDIRKWTRYFGCSCIRLPVLALQRTGIFTVLWTKLYGLNCCSFSSSVSLSLSSPNFHRPAGYCAPQDLLWHSRTVLERENSGCRGFCSSAWRSAQYGGQTRNARGLWRRCTGKRSLPQY